MAVQLTTVPSQITVNLILAFHWIIVLEVLVSNLGHLAKIKLLTAEVRIFLEWLACCQCSDLIRYAIVSTDSGIKSELGYSNHDQTFSLSELKAIEHNHTYNGTAGKPKIPKKQVDNVA